MLAEPIDMYTYSFAVLLSLSVVLVYGCNKQCRDKTGSTSTAVLYCEDQIITDVVDTINDLCRQINEKKTAVYCNHTVSLPPGIFAERPLNITLKYTDIQLEDNDYDLNPNKGEFNASVSFSYSNLTISVDEPFTEVIVSVHENTFKVVFSSKLFPDDNPNEQCFFEWNKIEVDKFMFEAAIRGPADFSRAITDKFKKENLQRVLNSKPLMDYLNKETSACNVRSFLHNVSGIFFSKLVLEELESFLSNLMKGKSV